MANDFIRRLLARIRTLREAQSLSQEAFAERAGLKYKHYQAIEAGRKPKIQLPTLIKIAEALEMKPWELLNLDVETHVLPNARTRKPAPTAPERRKKSKPGKKAGDA